MSNNNVKTKIKKVLTAGATVAMLSTSLISGAAAASFADYPAPFVKDGRFMSDAHIIVGGSAKSMDVIGAVDIAASLQSAAVSQEPVKVSSTCSGSGVTLIGEAAPFSEGSDLLVLRERLGEVKQKFTDRDLPVLLASNSDYEQTLSFNESDGSVVSGLVLHTEADVSADFSYNDGSEIDDAVDDFLRFQQGTSGVTDAIFEYELSFQSDFDWTVASDGTNDDSDTVTILGTDYTMVKRFVNMTTDDVILEFLGDVEESPKIKKLSEGADANFDPEADVSSYAGSWLVPRQLGGYDVRVDLDDTTDTSADVEVFYRNAGSDEWLEATPDEGSSNNDIDEKEIKQYNINRNDPNMTDEEEALFFVYLEDGDEQTDVYTAELRIGTNYLKLADTDYTDSTFVTAGTNTGVYVNNLDTGLSNGYVQIRGSEESSTKFNLDNIKYRLGDLYSDVFIPTGHGLRQYLTDEEEDISEMYQYGHGMLSKNWDISYEGMSSSDESSMEFQEKGGKRIDLLFTNYDGMDYDIQILQFETSGPISWAIDNNNLDDYQSGSATRTDVKAFVFTEGTYSGGNITNSSGTQISTSNEETTNLIYHQDVFLVSSDASPDRNVRSYLIEYNQRPSNANDNDLKFVGYGSSDDWTYPDQFVLTASTVDNILGSGDFTRGGYTFNYYVLNDSTLEYPVVVDLNADGSINQGTPVLADINGMNMEFPSQAGLNDGFKIASVSGNDDIALSANVATVNITMTVDSSRFDERTSDLVSKLNFQLTNASSEDADFNNLYSDQTTSGTFANIFETDSDSDNKFARDLFGTFYLLEQDANDVDDESNKVFVTVPSVQLSPQAFVTMGSVDRSSDGSGSVMSSSVNRARVGMAITDAQADARGLMSGSSPAANLIVVGGPCVNSVASALLGSPEDCAAGVEAGIGYLSMVESGDNVAILAYGLSAADTVAASEELARMGDGSSSRSGSSLEVSSSSGAVTEVTE